MSSVNSRDPNVIFDPTDGNNINSHLFSLGSGGEKHLPSPYK
jgi:hypothetical protein